MSSGIRAVIFDLGGVVLESPLVAFRRTEERLGVEPYFIGRAVMGAGESGAWARLERGELPLDEFHQAFDAELVAAGAAISSAELMAEMTAQTLVRPAMVAAIRTIRASGRRVAALTNNWVSGDAQYSRMRELAAEFDLFIESCKVGMRKPDPRIYELALTQLGVTPPEAAFLDDIGHNLKAARALGITTIKVTEPELALAELGSLLKLELRWAI
jgi:putative hydrolase of the HAD superfamily